MAEIPTSNELPAHDKLRILVEAAESRRNDDGILRMGLDFARQLLAESGHETKPDADHWLGELFSICHKDGGHYRADHGDEKATNDAIAYIYALREGLEGHDARVICPAEVDVRDIEKSLGSGWIHRLAENLRSKPKQSATPDQIGATPCNEHEWVSDARPEIEYCSRCGRSRGFGEKASVQRHPRNCSCTSCHYSQKFPQVKPHHETCGCFECSGQNGKPQS